MIRGVIYRERDPRPLLSDVMLATNPLERMRGLLGRPPLTDQQGLLIKPCSSIHTFGMQYPIDLAFLDRRWRIKKLVSSLKPHRFAWSPGAHMVIEMPAGTLTRLNLQTDMQLSWEKR